jgi:hypothetical protein
LDDLAAWEADEKLTLFPESPVRECKIHGGYGLAEYLPFFSPKSLNTCSNTCSPLSGSFSHFPKSFCL